MRCACCSLGLRSCVRACARVLTLPLVGCRCRCQCGSGVTCVGHAHIPDEIRYTLDDSVRGGGANLAVPCGPGWLGNAGGMFPAGVCPRCAAVCPSPGPRRGFLAEHRRLDSCLGPGDQDRRDVPTEVRFFLLLPPAPPFRCCWIGRLVVRLTELTRPARLQDVRSEIRLPGHGGAGLRLGRRKCVRLMPWLLAACRVRHWRVLTAALCCLRQ